MNAAAWSESTRGGGGTRGLRPGGARGVREAAAHVRVGSLAPRDATTAMLADVGGTGHGEASAAAL